MRISAVIPIYNVAISFLDACLDSLLKQTLRPSEYEIILVDDCSTNSETVALINAFALRVSNVKLVRHTQNRGLNEARRSGVKTASGDYIIFVDGDDILTRDAIENLRMEAHKTKADLVTAPFLRWNTANKSYAELPITAKSLPTAYIERLKAVIATEHSFTMCGRLFRRDILTDSIFDLPLGQLHEDVTTFVRVIFKSSSVAHIHRPIYFYTLNPTSITNKFTASHLNGIFSAFLDWIKNATHHGVFEQLSLTMPYGIEKLVNTCIERCVFSENLNIEDKFEILNSISQKYRALPLERPAPSLQWTKFLMWIELEMQGKVGQPIQVLEAVEQRSSRENPTQLNENSFLKRGLIPTELACRLKDKIVFICQVDYQLRNAASLARELRLRGHSCVVLDNSVFASGGLRQLSPKENSIFWRTEHIKIAQSPYESDWLSSAKLIITFNDFNDDFREALEYRHRLGLPSVCMVEGINDFLRVDFKGFRHLPYRRCDHVFLAGNDDKKYFEDRHTYVVGLPIIETLSTKIPLFPQNPLAVLNVNFTYGVLENEREEFISKAKNAFNMASFEWLITQHPMDKGELAGLPVSKRTQYELIDECTVFVSRFATGILEALASGKPVIYFNPHHEKVEKFKHPLGAYDIATSEEELTHALLRVLKDIAAGIDFRKRALAFLEYHTGYHPAGSSVLHRFADAVVTVLADSDEQQSAVSKLFLDRLHKKEPFRCKKPGLILGDFHRHHSAQFNEEELIARYFGDRGNIMIDVGANFGNSLDIYLGKGWAVHAFEPDPNNRKKLCDTWPSCSRLIINEEAVSNRTGVKIPFFASDESTGISSLSAFTKGHRKIADVTTTTLYEYYKKSHLKHIDFLKIDVEGFDKFVLDGFPWNDDRPEVILAEFEDAKTISLGYSAHDLASTLICHGYVVYVSEWLPIIRYGIAHDWKRLARYSSQLDLRKAWGNMIGFLEDPGEENLRLLAYQTIKFAPKSLSIATSKPRPQLSPTVTIHALPEIAGKPIQSCPYIGRNTLAILGNGPSLRGFDFTRLDGLATVGMNAAYRYWHQIGWYPTYYMCLDTVVTESHKAQIYELIQSSENNGILLFLVRQTLVNNYPELRHNPKVVVFDHYLESKYFIGIQLTTGSFAPLFGAMLGYRRICLLGIDLNYVQQIPEAKKVNGHVLEIKHIPRNNPNYFFDGYQRQGDRYNIPDSLPDLHYQSWVAAKQRLDELGVDVINANPQSRVDLFDIIDISDKGSF